MLEIVFFWLALAVAIGVWASNRGRSGVAWFLLAVLISPLLAAIFLAVSKNMAAGAGAVSGARGRCPQCDEDVSLSARVCKHCGAEISGQIVQYEGQRNLVSAIKNSSAYKKIFYTALVVFLFVAIAQYVVSRYAYLSQ